MTSLDGINDWSIQTLQRGENDSKKSDEIQARFHECIFKVTKVTRSQVSKTHGYIAGTKYVRSGSNTCFLQRLKIWLQDSKWDLKSTSYIPVLQIGSWQRIIKSLTTVSCKITKPLLRDCWSLQKVFCDKQKNWFGRGWKRWRQRLIQKPHRGTLKLCVQLANHRNNPKFSFWLKKPKIASPCNKWIN